MNGDWVTVDVPLRYPMKTRDGASLRVVTGRIREVGVADLAGSNAVSPDDACINDRGRAIGLTGVEDAFGARAGRARR